MTARNWAHYNGKKRYEYTFSERSLEQETDETISDNRQLLVFRIGSDIRQTVTGLYKRQQYERCGRYRKQSQTLE